MFKLHHIINEHPTWFTAEYFPVGKIFFKMKFIGLHTWALRKTEGDSLSDIEKLQLRRLQRLVSYAYKNIPFWREAMDKTGVKPRDIKRLQDVSKIPTTSKLIIKTTQLAELTSPLHKRLRSHPIITSGSTGEPTTIFIDNFTRERRLVIRERSFRWLIGPRSKEDHYIRIARTSTFYPGFSVIRTTEFGTLHSVKKKLYDSCRDGHCIVTSYPSILSHIAKLIKDDGHTLPLKGIVTSGEKLENAVSDKIREVFQCPIGERYTSSEGSGTIAQTCKFGNYHVNPDQSLVEIIRKEKGSKATLPFGKILVTDFNNYVMPIIRYDTGDLGLMQKSNCKCDSVFPIIVFQGRASSVVHLPDKRKLHTFVLFRPFAVRRSWILQYQILRTSTNHFKVNLVAEHSHTKADIDDLKEELKSILGKNVALELQLVPEIKTSFGEKFRPFISKVPQDQLVETN